MRKLILPVDNYMPNSPFMVLHRSDAEDPDYQPYSTLIAAAGNAGWGAGGVSFGGRDGLCYSVTTATIVWDFRGFEDVTITSGTFELFHRGHGSYPTNLFPTDAAGGYGIVPLDENYAAIQYIVDDNTRENYHAGYLGALTGVEFIDRVLHSDVPDDHDYHKFTYTLTSAAIAYLNTVKNKPNFPGYAFFGITLGGIIDGVLPTVGNVSTPGTGGFVHSAMSTAANPILLLDFDETLVDNAVQEQIELPFLDGHVTDPTRFAPAGEAYSTIFGGEGTTGNAGTKSVRLEPHLDLANPGLWDRNSWLDLLLDFRPFRDVIFTHPCTITLVDVLHANKNLFNSDTRDGIALIKHYESYNESPSVDPIRYERIKEGCKQAFYFHTWSDEYANRITRTELIAASASGGNVTFTLNQYGLNYLNSRMFVRSTGYELLTGWANFAIVWGGQIDSSNGGSPTFLHNTAQVVTFEDIHMDLTYIVRSGNRLNVGDEWKYVTGGMINVGDSWKQADEIELNVDDEWKGSNKIP